MHDVEFQDQVSSLRSIDNIAYSASKSSSGWSSDEQLLARFGKEQQFKRNFNLLTVIALCSTVMNAWAGMLSGLQLVLFNGGPTGFLISFPIVFLGVLMQALVVAELASMIPLSGGQYNWVAILAPRRLSNFLSYFVGWIVTIAWQAGAAGVAFLTSNVILGLASAVHPDYEMKKWHVTLAFFAVITLAVLVTTVLGRLLPTIESVAFVIFVMGFFVLIIVLKYLAPKTDSSQVFQNFFNGGGWNNNVEATFVGAIPIMFGFNGFDAGVHLAEEVKDASRVVPKATIISVGLYFVMGYSMAIMILYCFSLEEVLTSTYSIPVIGIFRTVTQSSGGTAALTSLIIIMLIFGTIGSMATASRMLWAFAREEGVPCSRHISKIERNSGLPLYSIATTALLSMLFALIGLGSDAAFSALTGLTVASFYAGFMVCAILLLYRHFTVPNMPWGPFRLGIFRVPVAILSLAYSTLTVSIEKPLGTGILQDNKIAERELDWALKVLKATTKPNRDAKSFESEAAKGGDDEEVANGDETAGGGSGVLVDYDSKKPPKRYWNDRIEERLAELIPDVLGDWAAFSPNDQSRASKAQHYTRESTDDSQKILHSMKISAHMM
ncbi:hypothetical protein HBI24_123450 [Parastagonospora nodorum]|nr:hypothetical protein HBH52_008730 [Parastagonospora nodorum]KAH4059606.1 hypothetical protein HBH49_020450 [Parastagonospora nodorum]KAH4312587.1 hypothetical protein HBI01_008400 [Parastagonospora nodorum]KAH4316228.1 hypothetical protein HBI02_046000 [Parastagonospora nodorum]KAH4332597.1 hypothetical protein HBI00_060450 [Parastagonospora nodorum]